jgi:hypothetical protein
MATLSDPQTAAPLPGNGRPTREIQVRNTFLSRLWATIRETIAHPFTRSVLILEDQPGAPSDVEAAPRN